VQPHEADDLVSQWGEPKPIEEDADERNVIERAMIIR
jgi:hypothetical protein